MTDRPTLAQRLRAPSMTDTTATHIDRMRMAADEIERLTREIAELKADRDSWIEQASQRAQETVEAMQQVEAYRLRCEALHSAPQEPPSCPEGHGTMAGYFDGWRCNYCGCKAGAASGARVNSAASAPREPLTKEQRQTILNTWRGRDWRSLDDLINDVERAHGIGADAGDVKQPDQGEANAA